ncbi:hypothetical protein [Streptomyces sp. NPDC097619]|uniref:hypothetical protein n=1 Tax=Streptomyces sp. NPDC097619 TaxID=3157228 RepID=UPI0033297D9B
MSRPRTDPQEPPATRPGRPGSPAGRRRAPWAGHRAPAGPARVLLLAASMALVVLGMVLPQGLVLATGLVTAGIVAQQIAAAPHRTRPRGAATDAPKPTPADAPPAPAPRRIPRSAPHPYDRQGPRGPEPVEDTSVSVRCNTLCPSCCGRR